ncbi:MAG: hypothetical protein WAU32_14115 [Thermoanaerobaculia bacterium]
MTSQGHRAQTAVALLGAALIVGWGVARLPKRASYLRLSNTPIDNSGNKESAPAFRLLTEAAEVVPPGASVFVGHTVPDPIRDTYLHRFAVALLPERRVLPAAVWGVAVSPSPEPYADYVLLLGARPAVPRGKELLATPDGTVWRRKP